MNRKVQVLDSLQKFQKIHLSDLNELKNIPKSDFVFISGGFSYWNRLETIMISEQKCYQIFFIQLIYLLTIHNQGGHFIMWLEGMNHNITKEFVYIMSMFYEKIHLIKMKGDTTVLHMVGINFLGIGKKNLKILYNICKYLSIKNRLFGENLNIKNQELRKYYDIRREWKKGDTDLFIHQLFKLKMDKQFTDKINRFTKKTLKKQLQVFKTVYGLVNLLKSNIKYKQKLINRINDESIEMSIKYCIENNIEISKYYLKH